MELFIRIGFLPITIWDILDVIIVGYLIYQIYKLLRGSGAFPIFIALIMIYVVGGIVQLLNMELLSNILQQLGNVGVLALLIVFQPEVRRFLIFLGRGTLKGRSNFFRRFLNKDVEITQQKEGQLRDIIRAVENLSKNHTGALMVFSTGSEVEDYVHSGVRLEAEISNQLLESIFNKDSPLHDGAVIIADGKVMSAGCVLPVSENPNLPKRAGLRHRAGVGITEGTEATAVIVSEESGRISVATKGNLNTNLTADQIDKYLRDIFSEFYS